VYDLETTIRKNYGFGPVPIDSVTTIPLVFNAIIIVKPTIPFTDAGHVTEPSVSVPIATVQRFAATAVPEPELDPHGL